MTFVKGRMKTGGRKKGVGNKAANRRPIIEAVEQYFPLFMEVLLQLAKTDPKAFAQMYLKLMTFAIPTLQSITAENDVAIKTGIDDILRQRMSEQI